MTDADLTRAERAVALALYRHGDGANDDATFFAELEHDPIGQQIAQEVTPILANLARSITPALTTLATS